MLDAEKPSAHAPPVPNSHPSFTRSVCLLAVRKLTQRHQAVSNPGNTQCPSSRGQHALTVLTVEQMSAVPAHIME